MPNFNIILNGFGLQNVQPITYTPQGKGLSAPKINNYAAQEGESIQYLHGGGPYDNLTSYLGTPVFADLRFDNSDLWLDTVLLDVSQTKNIVTTAITGRNGTIKEYISDGDYVVNIKGAITTQGNGYPMSDVRGLLSILRKKETLQIVSDYLRIFDIYQIVVTDYKFSQVEGFQNTQFFEINAISDTPEVFITKK